MKRLANMNTQLQVMATIDSLPYHSGPNVSEPVMGQYSSGEIFTSDTQTVDNEGTLWVHDITTGYWSMFRTNTMTYLKPVGTDTAVTTGRAASKMMAAKASEPADWVPDTIDTWPQATSPDQYKSGKNSSSSEKASSIKLPSYSEWVPKIIDTLHQMELGSNSTRVSLLTKSSYGSSYKLVTSTVNTPTFTPRPAQKHPENSSNHKTTKVDTTGRIPKVSTEDVSITNSSNYPLSKGSKDGMNQYDYTMSTHELDEYVNVIRKNMNIPSLYNIQQINRLMHTQFNRYRIAYPDFERTSLIPYVYFTRPDLNLYDSEGNILSQFGATPALKYLIQSYPLTAKSLTILFDPTHDFNPLLCNRVGSLDVQDDVVETHETGETFTGYKSQYAKHNVKSKTAGSFSIKFPESFNMAITIMHQIWCTYMAAVYRGHLEPKIEYMGGKILDYACDIYYFLCDRDNVIRFWTKYYGCFPSSVSKSMLSYDAGSLITFPESSIQYNFIFKDDDMSPTTIAEFNNNSKLNSSAAAISATQISTGYSRELGIPGPTWTGAPFIDQIMVDEGYGTKVQRFILKHRVAPADTMIAAALPDSVIQRSGMKVLY